MPSNSISLAPTSPAGPTSPPARKVSIPIIGVGGITTLDDVMEFLVAGASAVQLGTVHFFDPTSSMRLLDALPEAIASLNAKSVREIVGSVKLPG